MHGHQTRRVLIGEIGQLVKTMSSGPYPLQCVAQPCPIEAGYLHGYRRLVPLSAIGTLNHMEAGWIWPSQHKQALFIIKSFQGCKIKQK